MSGEVGPVIRTVDAEVCPEDRWSKMRWTTTATRSSDSCNLFFGHRADDPHKELTIMEIEAIMRMIGL